MVEEILFDENKIKIENFNLNDLTDEEIAKVIGLTVEIKIENGDILTGVIYSLLKQNSLLILLKRDEQNSLNSYLINISKILEIKVSDEKLEVDFNEITSPNLDKIFDNEKKNLEKETLLRKAELDRNESAEYKQIYQKGFAIYEKLCKLYKCSYENNKIILEELDAYIEEPFNIENLHCEDDYTKKRLTKLIEASFNK